jgi:hypothetical protein
VHEPRSWDLNSDWMKPLVSRDCGWPDKT